jgi:hypothetical protein
VHYVNAAWWLRVASGSHLLSTLMAAASVLLAQCPGAASILAPFGGVAAVASYLASWWHDRSKQEAERLQRRLLFADGLGDSWAYSAREKATLSASLSPRLRALALRMPTAGQYYDSKLEPGPMRLLDNAQESAFFSQHIALHAATRYWVWFGILVAVSLVSIYVSTWVLHGPALNVLVRVAVMFLFAALLLGVARRAAGLSALARACDSLDERMEALWQGGASGLEQVLPLVHEYQCALLVAPLFPSDIYRRELNELNKQWEARVQARPARDSVPST